MFSLPPTDSGGKIYLFPLVLGSPPSPKSVPICAIHAGACFYRLLIKIRFIYFFFRSRVHIFVSFAVDAPPVLCWVLATQCFLNVSPSIKRGNNNYLRFASKDNLHRMHQQQNHMSDAKESGRTLLKGTPTVAAGTKK